MGEGRDATPDRLGPRAAEAFQAALRLLEEEGPEAVTIRRVGAAMGIRGPSVYNHVPDKATLEAGIAAIGLEEMDAALAAAAPGLAGLAAAYRGFARSRPHLYRALTERRLPRELLPPGLEERVGRHVFIAAGGDRDRARAMWAAAHGLAILELANRLQPDADIDATWDALVRAFEGGERSRG